MVDFAELVGLSEADTLVSFLLRIVAIYFVIVIAVRLTGKRGIGQATALDFILALAVGDTVGEAAYGIENFWKWVIIVALWILLHAIMSLLGIRNPTISELISGKKALVIRDGVIIKKTLDKEMVSEAELMMLLRSQSIEDVSEVREAYLEPDGKLSVFKKSSG